MNNKKTPLFRKEAIDAIQNQWAGKVIITNPISFKILTFFAFSFALFLMLVLIFGTYTDKTTVEGQLLPLSGVVRIYPNNIGTVEEIYIQDGDFVKKGDKLFLISNEYYNQMGNVSKYLIKEAENKKDNLEKELEVKQIIYNNEQQNIKNKITHLTNRHKFIQKQLQDQKRRVFLAKEVLNKYKELEKYKAVSLIERVNQENILLSEQSNLNLINSQEISMREELDELNVNLSVLPERFKVELSQLERELSVINQEILELKSKSNNIIQADKSGVISTININIGQKINADDLMATIIPKNSELFANLYVPSRAMGFIKEQDQVILRYQSYPYQKYGFGKGKIVFIGKTALNKQELNSLGTVSKDLMQLNEPTYLIKVKLDKQTITIKGEENPLQIGMLLEADIHHKKSKFYEILFEPILRISKKTL